jgi:ankyrin repeat protein
MKKSILFCLLSVFVCAKAMEPTDTERLLQSIQQSGELSFVDQSRLMTRNQDGETLCHLICKQGDTKRFVKIMALLSYSNIGTLLFQGDNYGYLPIHKAAQEGYDRIICELVYTCYMVDKSPNELIFHNDNRSGSTSLHFAATRGNLQVAEELIKLSGKSALELIFAKNHLGHTALTLAACAGHAQVVTLLMKAAGSSALKLASLHDNGGITPLHWAVYGGHKAVIEAFIELAGDELLTYGDLIRSGAGLTILDYAIKCDKTEIIKLLEDAYRQRKECSICCNNYSQENPSVQLFCCKQLLCLSCIQKSIVQGYQCTIQDFGTYGEEYHRCPFCRAEISTLLCTCKEDK